MNCKGMVGIWKEVLYNIEIINGGTDREMYITTSDGVHFQIEKQSLRRYMQHLSREQNKRIIKIEQKLHQDDLRMVGMNTTLLTDS